MATAANRMDELVKDYLLFRGLTGSLKSFENELKTDKEKGLRVDKITDQIQAYVSTFDLLALRDYWTYLSNKFFCRLEQKHMGSVRKLEVGLFKFYLVTASQSNRQDKIKEFFEVMTPELQNQVEFKEWFTFPFIRSPEDNSHFTLYFTRQWQDTFFLSLHNFISVMLQAMPPPILLSFEHDQKKIRALREENDTLRSQIRNHPDFQTKPRSHTVMSGVELMDDFFSISGDSLAQESQTRVRSEKKFFNFPSSPLLRKKPGTPKVGLNSDIPAKIQGQNQSRNSRNENDRDETLNNSSARNTVKSKSTGHPQPPTQVTPSIAVTMATGISQGQATLGTPPENRYRKPEEKDRFKRDRKKEEYDRQRKELFGKADNELRRSKRNGDNNSVALQPLRSSISEVEPPTRMPVEPVPGPPSTGTVDPGTSIDKTTECPFLLLSQEEYGEHNSAISTSYFNNSGDLIASSDIDGVVKVWSWSPQPLTKATIMSKSPFLSLSWTSKSDKLLLLGNKSGSIKLFDVQDLKTIIDVAAEHAHPRLISLCSNPASTQFVCSGSAEKYRSNSGGERASGRVGRLSVWELKTMKMTGVLPVGPGPVAVNCSCYNHNGQLLLTGAADGIIRVFDMRQLSCIGQWTAHHGEVLTIQLSSDENNCYSMGSDGKFLEWSINNRGRKVADLPIHPGACPTLPSSTPAASRDLPKGKLFAYDTEGVYALTCSRSGGIIYQRTSESPGLARTMELKGHRTGVTAVDWSPVVESETRVCLTGAMDGKVKVSTLLSG